VDLHPGFLMKGMCYFPVVGMIVGVLTALVFDFGHVVWELPAPVSAALSTAASFRLTGCLHEDGLADSADGIGGGWTRQQILRIMTDTRLGTFGSAALILYVFTKLELLAALGASHWQNFDMEACGVRSDELISCGANGAGPALVVTHALGRLTSPYLIHTNVYVEEDGPKSHFYSFMIRAKFLVSLPRLAFSILFCLMLASFFYGPVVAAALLAVVWICAECAGIYGRYKLGGVMGDYLGATTCLTELVVMACIQTRGSLLASFRTWSSLINRLLKARDLSLALEVLNSSFKKDPKLRLLLLSLLTIILHRLWCWMMGPSLLDSTSSSVDEDINDTETTEVMIRNANVCPEKEKAEEILASSTSSFFDMYSASQRYLDILAKPVGSLGTLEEWAARLCALQQTLQPKAEPVGAIIFAADHGVACRREDGGEGCSLYVYRLSSHSYCRKIIGRLTFLLRNFPH
jgi:adenosylcobinamide-GDP ribazoletransferase